MDPRPAWHQPGAAALSLVAAPGPLAKPPGLRADRARPPLTWAVGLPRPGAQWPPWVLEGQRGPGPGLPQPWEGRLPLDTAWASLDTALLRAWGCTARVTRGCRGEKGAGSPARVHPGSGGMGGPPCARFSDDYMSSHRADCWAWVHPLGAPPWPPAAPACMFPWHGGCPAPGPGAPSTWLSEGCTPPTRPGPVQRWGQQSELLVRGPPPCAETPRPPAVHRDPTGRPPPLTQHPHPPSGVLATGAPAPPGSQGAPWPEGGHW